MQLNNEHYLKAVLSVVQKYIPKFYCDKDSGFETLFNKNTEDFYVFDGNDPIFFVNGKTDKMSLGDKEYFLFEMLLHRQYDFELDAEEETFISNHFKAYYDSLDINYH